jgi:hypothetical protein
LRYSDAYDIATLLPHIWVTHVKTKGADAQGRLASCDLGRAFAMLRKNGCKGPISIEFEGRATRSRECAKPGG